MASWVTSVPAAVQRAPCGAWFSQAMGGGGVRSLGVGEWCVGTSPLSVPFTLLFLWLHMKEPICLLPVIEGGQSVRDTLHFEPVDHPPTSTLTHGTKQCRDLLLSILGFFSACFTSLAIRLCSYYPHFCHLRNAVVPCCCRPFVLSRQMFFFLLTKNW